MLWGKNDNAANTPKSAVYQVDKPFTANNQTELYQNNTPNVFFVGATVGVWGIDNDEQQAGVASGSALGAHAGWNMRTVGTGLKAGVVKTETLVAMKGSMLNRSGSSIYPNVAIVITDQPEDSVEESGNAISFYVGAVSVPAGKTLTYRWRNNGVDISNGGVFGGATSNTLTISDNSNLSSNLFSVRISTPFASNVISSNASISYIS